MKKKLLSLFIILFIIVITYNTFYHSIEINSIISFSIDIFVKNIFPSLFPMFIISSLLISIGIPDFLGNIFSKVMVKLFNVKGISSFVFFMSILSGYPSNARYIKDLLDSKTIDEIDANKILLFTSFANPLFIINTIGILMFNSTSVGLYILISHVLGNITIGLLFRNMYKRKENNVEKVNIKQEIKKLHKRINNTKIFKTFLESINRSLAILMNIFGIITCFLIVIEIISISLNLNNASDTLLTSCLEFASGLKKISNIDTFNSKIYLSMFFISFGGLSVHAQIISILENYRIKYFLFLLARILHGLISIVYLHIFINL